MTSDTISGLGCFTVGALRSGSSPLFGLNGDLAAVAVYSRALITRERAAVESYFRSKWRTP
jgi:hypothetical protein